DTPPVSQDLLDIIYKTSAHTKESPSDLAASSRSYIPKQACFFLGKVPPPPFSAPPSPGKLPPPAFGTPPSPGKLPPLTFNVSLTLDRVLHRAFSFYLVTVVFHSHRQTLYPGVIVEVYYSQKSRRISHLADKYILNTDRSINTVVALDIDYEGSNRATITVWRPEYAIVDSMEEFRANAVIETDSGFPTEETVLRLSLKDFATEELAQGYTQQQGSINRIRPGTLKRRRPQTPPKQLSSEDKGSIKRKRESKRRHQSSDYRPSSSSVDSKGDLP
ncbi:hypothetical protein N7527_004682, partial [Penicillium freii]